jgi:hypothetical protein
MIGGLIIALYVVGVLLLFVGAYVQQWAPITGAVFMVTGGAMAATHLLGHVTYEVYRRRQARSILRNRPQLDSVSFGVAFFNDTVDRASLAARLRDSLAEFVKLPLEGLRPDDNIDDVLYTDTTDPSLIWHLEDEFQLGQSFADAETFNSTRQSLHTFRDLLAFLEERINDIGPSNP